MIVAMVNVTSPVIDGFSRVDLLWLTALTVQLQVSDYSQLSDYSFQIQLYRIYWWKLSSQCTNCIWGNCNYGYDSDNNWNHRLMILVDNCTISLKGKLYIDYSWHHKVSSVHKLLTLPNENTFSQRVMIFLQVKCWIIWGSFKRNLIIIPKFRQQYGFFCSEIQTWETFIQDFDCYETLQGYSESSFYPHDLSFILWLEINFGFSTATTS